MPDDRVRAYYGGEDNPYEAIKVIESWDLGFCLGNVVKYISRAGKKDPAALVEDLRKASWYLEREIKRLGGDPMCFPEKNILEMIRDLQDMLEAERQKIADNVMPEPLPIVRSCNRHDDCDSADRAAKLCGLFCAEHCRDECCEDCFGA